MARRNGRLQLVSWFFRLAGEYLGLGWSMMVTRVDRMVSDKSVVWLRWAAVLGAVGVFGYYVYITLHWAVVWDSAVMHYVVFLVGKGFRPYAQISDMNMPGTYIAEQAGMAVFGWSDLSWRVYEFFLLLVMTVAGMVIGGRKNWVAGPLAAAFFIAMHGAEGPIVATERDELMTVLLVCATATTVLAARRRMAVLMLPFGLLAGFAASIKPTSLVFETLLLGMFVVMLRRRGEPVWRYVLWALVGNAVVSLGVLGYLWHYDAVGAFAYNLRSVLPAYASSTTVGFGTLLGRLFPERLLWVVPFAVAGLILRKGRVGWEGAALLCGAGVGALSFFAQRKGYNYHRYMFVEFLLLWIALELAEAMRRGDAWPRFAGAAGVVVLFVLAVPHYVRVMARDSAFQYRVDGLGVPDGLALTATLERDLRHLGVDRLQGQVLCLDLVSSCLNGLYRMRIVESVPYTGDMLLFAPMDAPAVSHYRDQLMEQQRTRPADVIVLGNEWFYSTRPNFNKVELWPEFAAHLRDGYKQVVERRLSGGPDAEAYRLYLRNGSSVLTDQEKNPL